MVMKEQDYINVRELSNVMNAKGILRDIIPENSKVITQDKLSTVMKILSEWQDELFSIIKTEDED
jgi:hypothetical protein